jgi:carbon-monoxide dehydrogenase large subunit
MSILGTRVARTGDPRLLTAGGTYVDDLRLPELAGAVRATFVRSPVAHALITGIDVAAAAAAPGVVAVLTAADADDLPPTWCWTPVPGPGRYGATRIPGAHLGVRHIEMPTTPERVWAAINEARAGQ